MPEQARQVIAAHYFYLLQEDEADLQKLWSSLTAAAGGAPENAAYSLDLAAPAGEAAGRCQIVHRVQRSERDFCLTLISGLAVVEVLYRRVDFEPPQQAWPAALRSIDADRGRAGALGVPLFGETTVLVTDEDGETGPRLANVIGTLASRKKPAAEAGAAPGAIRIRHPVPATRILVSELDRAVAASGSPLLFNAIDHGDRSRDFFAVSSPEPGLTLSTMLPQLDAFIKKLGRQASHFSDQRRAIADERSQIDKQVAAILHQQVVTVTNGAGTGRLEDNIAHLSRMFGMLATDALLVRQAEDRLRNGLEALDAALGLQLKKGPGAKDEIGSHYRAGFSADLEDAHTEAVRLNFSRQNAQAAIEVVRTQVELLRAGEEAAIQNQTKELLSRSLLVQQERLALQVAAGFVEFVLVFYYVLKSWEGIAGQNTVDSIPAALRLLIIGGISAGAAAGTHFLARALHRRSMKNPGLWISAAVLLLALAAMIIFTVALS